MATKITIDELVTKFVFEVDDSGAKTYEKQLKDTTKEHKKQSGAQQKTEDRAQKETSRRLKTRERAVKRSSERETRARRTANAAQAKGDTRSARRSVRVAERAASQKIRAERRLTRQLGREQRKRARAERRTTKTGGGTGALGAKVSGITAGAAALGPVGIAAAGATAAIAGAGAAISTVADETARLDKIAKGAQQTGLGVEAYQRLSHVATLSGTSVDDLSKGVIKLNRGLGDVAQGRGAKVSDNLQKLGLSLKDLEGVDPTKQLSIISDAMATVDNDVERTAISIELFGKAGAELVPLLNSGSTAIKEMSDATGRVFTREELAPAEAYQDALAKLDQTTSMLSGNLVLGLAPILQDVVEFFTRTVPIVQEFAEVLTEDLREAFGDLGSEISELAGGSGLEFKDLLDAIAPPLRTAAALTTFFTKTIATLLSVGNKVISWVREFLDFFETRWPRAFEIAGNVVSALIHPLESVRNVISRILDFIEKSVGEIEVLQNAVQKIRAALPGGGEDGAKAEKSAEDTEKRAERSAKGSEARLRARERRANAQAKAEQERDASTAEATAEFQRRGGGRKKGKGGKKRAPTGLEAQLESQIKKLAAQAEIRTSAQALQAGTGSQDAFAAGRKAASETESLIRSRFESTGELPIGIERDIASLARSPAVEDSIGRVPPPVISVVTNRIEVTGNEMKIEIEAMLAAGVGIPELERMSARGIETLIQRMLKQGKDNLDPKVRV